MIAWPVVSLADVASPEKRAIISGPFGSNIGKRFFVPYGVPVIRGNNLANPDLKFSDDGFVYITEEKAATLNCWAYPDDLIFTAAGSLGQVGVIPKNGRHPRYTISNKQLRIRLDKTKIVPAFAYYYFSAPDMRAYVIGQNKGSSVPLITLGVLRALPIPQPPLPIQSKIAAILSAYDDLMENNGRRIKLLEEIVQRIYREWFVEFRYPGHEGVPLVDSELGPIPTGWEVGRLGDLVDINALTIRKIDPNESIRYIDISSVTRGTVAEPKTMPLIDAPGRARRRVMDGDILWSTVRPNLRAYALFLSPETDYVASTGFAVLSPRRVSFSYVYALTTAVDFVEYLSGRATGSAYPAVTPIVFSEAPVVIPRPTVLNGFASIAEPVLRMSALLAARSSILAATRVTLLPRLISGEIDVTDLDIAMPEAAA